MSRKKIFAWWLFLLVTGMFFSFPLPVAAAPGVRHLTVACDRWPAVFSLEKFTSDCIRLAGAGNDEARALAVWKYIQYLTAAGKPPREPARGENYILDPLKLLNVYGVHWCDGLARIMTSCWRSRGGRAEKLYKFGHTLADCYWRDADGIDRWHVFDVSQHWYVFDRSGTHIATADELALDDSLISFPSRTPVPSWPSPPVPSWVHAPHLWPLPYREMSLSLRLGEKLLFQWGNEGKPYYDLWKGARGDKAWTPYPRTYGNGRLTWSLDFAALSPAAAGVELRGFQVVRQEGRTCLRPQPGVPSASLVIPVSLPYVISDAWVVLDGDLGTAGRLRLFLSFDAGHHWRPCRLAGDGVSGPLVRKRLDFCPVFDPAAGKKPSVPTPFGRYQYWLKIEVAPGDDPAACTLERLLLTTVFQHNLLALPMLWPGRNRITVDGDLDRDIHLKVSYRWVEGKKGKERQQTEVFATLPAVYQLKTRGRRWSDCRCLDLEIEAVPAGGQRRHQISSPPDVRPRPLPPVRKVAGMLSAAELVGGGRKPRLRSAGFYRRQLEKLLAAVAARRTDDRFLRKKAGEIGRNVLALGALGASGEAAVLARVVREDVTSPCANKIKACQALYRAGGSEVVPTMLAVLRRDPAITWYDPRHHWPVDTMWLHTAAVAAAILADLDSFPERAEAAALVAAILRGEKSRFPPAKLWRGREICWGLIKNLGRLGGDEYVPLLRRYLERDDDAGAQAALALGYGGSAEAVPGLVKRLQHFAYPPVGLHSIQALGKCGSAAAGKWLYPFLDHWDEDFRGAAAAALGEMGVRAAVPRLQKLMAAEPFPWVREAATASLKSLGDGE